MGIAVYSLQLIVYSLRLISWLFADNLQISCGFLGGFEKKRNFGGKLYKLTELSQVSSTRPERAEAPSPGHRPG